MFGSTTSRRRAFARSEGRVLVRLALVAGLIVLLAIIAIPNLLRERTEPPEAVAVASLRTIVAAATQYTATYHNGFPPGLEVLSSTVSPDPASCDHANLIDPVLASGTKYRYVFAYSPRFPAGRTKPAKGCSVAGAVAFTVSADPVKPRSHELHFFVDETGVIHYESDKPATSNSTALQ
jgi:hypothetical protein